MKPTASQSPLRQHVTRRSFMAVAGSGAALTALAACGTGPSSSAGSSGGTAANPVTITIGSLKDKIAGNYSDNIVVTVATTE